MTQFLIFCAAVVIIGARLPSVMRRLEIKGKEKIAFVLMAYGLLVAAWFAVSAIGLLF